MVRIVVAIIFSFGSLGALAQVMEFSNLKRLPATVNSAGEESMPLLSPDQSKLFFVRSLYDGNTGGRFAGQDIWCSEISAAGFQRSTNKIQSLNNKENNVLIGINSDGTRLFTMNSSPSSKLEGFYFTRMTSSGSWTRPEFVPLNGIENEDFVGMYVSPAFDVILLSMRGRDSRGEEDIYYCVKSGNGEWSRPVNIGPAINTTGYEISPFLSEDKKRIYFASNGHEGFGDADIFYSERLYDSWETWSTPVNLGPVVNSKKFDAYFSIYGDSVAYFTSNRESDLADIYKVKVTHKIEFLPPGKQYISQQEWDAVVGKNVQVKLSFDKQAKVLSAAQKELLYYMANKLYGKRDLNIHLLVREEEDPELTRLRLREIYGELRQAGIDGYRIYEEQKPETIKRSNNGVIEVLLFK